ncbi:hypothetical protein AtEden1_Chr5g0112991 [Arabidopsis thaliana]
MKNFEQRTSDNVNKRLVGTKVTLMTAKGIMMMVFFFRLPQQ